MMVPAECPAPTACRRWSRGKPRLRMASAARSPSMPMRSGITYVVACSPRLRSSETSGAREAGGGFCDTTASAGSQLDLISESVPICTPSCARRIWRFARSVRSERHDGDAWSRTDPHANRPLPARARAAPGSCCITWPTGYFGIGTAVVVNAQSRPRTASVSVAWLDSQARERRHFDSRALSATRIEIPKKRKDVAPSARPAGRTFRRSRPESRAAE
jgi:hypothetical protein